MRVLFVCTGNICRSPFAEYLARKLSDRPDVDFASAGTFARPGNPAYEQGRVVAAQLGIDMEAHGATPLTRHVVAKADLIYGMEEEHVEAVLEVDRAARVQLLRPDDEAIPDPYGEDREAYLQVYQMIEAALRLRLAELDSA